MSDIVLMGATYPSVPAVQLPKAGGGTATFTETAGSQTFTENGTYDVTSLAQAVVDVSGGGGGSSWELLASQDFTAETTSTSQTNIGTISCGSGAFVAGDFIYVRVRDKAGKRAGYFYGTDNFYANINAANGSTSAFSVSAKYTHRVNSAGNYATYASNSAYGVYSLGISSSGNITIASKYSANNSLTINGTYAVEVYKLTLANGEKVFD